MPPLLILILLPLSLFPVASAQGGNTGPTGPYYNNAYSPSFAIIIAILVAALFLTGVFSIYLRHCGRSSAALPSLSTRGGGGGLDAAIMQSFPTLEYSAVRIHKIGKGALECAICLNEFDDSQRLRVIPICDHVFHPDCIHQWLSSHTTCPVCRADLTAPAPAPVPEVNHKMDGHPTTAPPVWVWWARSHSTGHSLTQPDRDRYTLRLPPDVRNRLLNQRFHRATSLVVLPRESASRRLSRGFSWVFTMAPPFFVRASSLSSPKVATTSSDPIMPQSAVHSSPPPV